MRRFVLALLVVLVPVRAVADEASEARLQYELGVELYRQGRYAEALERFLGSNRLAPNPNVVFNIAEIYRRDRRWLDAYNWYETYLTEFDVDDAGRQRATRARAELLPRVAVIDVRAEPAGGALFLDRVELGSVGRAPRQVAVEPGERTVIVRLDGHREARASVTAERGRVSAVIVTLEAVRGTLSVTSEPSGAEVFLDGGEAAVGVTPLSLSLPVGTARVVLRHAGYSEQSRTVRILDGETSAVSATLERLASTVAVLSVVTRPGGAAVLLDGALLGTAPLTLDRVEPGVRRLEVRRDGLESWSTPLVLEAGGATRVSVTLEDPSAFHFSDVRWIGHALGGATFLAGVGVAIGAVLERDAFFASADPTRGQLDVVHTLNATADALMVTGLVVVATTLVLDLALGNRPRSQGRVALDR